MFTEEINKLPLSSSDVKEIQSNYSIEKYAHTTSKYLGFKKEEIECYNIIKQYINV